MLIVAGEASADLHGSNLVRAIKRLDPHVSFSGIGGRKMEDAGVKILFSSSDMAVVGLTEVLSKLQVITRAYFKLRTLLKKEGPELLILLDYPDFNLRLARSAKRFNVPVLYYIGPQLWAWRGGRIKQIVRRVDRMAVILPFEEPLYRQRGVDVEYVGHPLLDTIPTGLTKQDMIEELGLEASTPVLGLLPGSRKEEVTNLLPSMIKAAEILSRSYPNLKCVLPLASTIPLELIESMTRTSSAEVRIFQGSIYKALKTCDLALVASGTATLETAMMEVPMVIVYRVSLLSYWIGRMVVKVPHIGLVNLVAGEEIVPELIQDDVNPDRLAQEAQTILEGGRIKENMIRKLGALKEKLGKGNPAERTAQIAMEMMRRH